MWLAYWVRMVLGLVDKSHNSIIISSLVCLASLSRVRICLVLSCAGWVGRLTLRSGTDLTTHTSLHICHALSPKPNLRPPTNSTGEHD